MLYTVLYRCLDSAESERTLRRTKRYATYYIVRYISGKRNAPNVPNYSNYQCQYGRVVSRDSMLTLANLLSRRGGYFRRGIS
jgi:hypothetical protein